jgi:hypothetical protein
MKMYEAAPGHWLIEGVSMAEHRSAMAGNYEGPMEWEDFDQGREPSQHFGDRHKVWTTKEGMGIPYAELGDRHLSNIVNMLRRTRPGEIETAFPNLLAEAGERGGGA